jgi:hypothetical protein
VQIRVSNSFLNFWFGKKGKGPAAGEPSPSAVPAVVPVLLVQIMDNDIGEASAIISEAVSSIRRAEGIVYHIVCGVILAVFDPPPIGAANGDSRCEEAAYTLQRTLGEKVKMLYGPRNVVLLKFSAPSFMYYGPFIKGLGKLLEQLRTLEYGTVRKFGEDDME